MSEDYEKNDRIPPFKLNSDPSILLNNEDTPWLWRDHNQGTYIKKKFIVIPTWYGDVLDLLCNNCDFRFFYRVFHIFYGLNEFSAWRWISYGECAMKNQMINVNKMWKLISYWKAIVLMILIK